jgi:mitotic spindle assembly checkpoint protein MAD2B
VAVKIFLEFLEVATHMILYTRSIYPPGTSGIIDLIAWHRVMTDRSLTHTEIFEKRSKYEIPVHMSRHPELNSYIASTLGGLRTAMCQVCRMKCCLSPWD